MAKKSTTKVNTNKTKVKSSIAIRAFFISKESKLPISNMPVIASIEVTHNKTTRDLIIAKLGTGINGYASFKVDVRRIIEKSKISIYPLGQPNLKEEIDLDFLIINDEYVHSFEVSDIITNLIKPEDLPSVQDPDIIDYKFLPMYNHSFKRAGSDESYKQNIKHTVNPNNTDDPNAPDHPIEDAPTEEKPNCGCNDDDNCSVLVPQIPEKECIKINQFQTNPAAETSIYSKSTRGDNIIVTEGLISVYETCHSVLGYSLGTLINTIPLAPCESVNYNVKNWFREDKSQRSDSATRNQSLDSDIIKSKSTTEFIKSKMRESKFNFGASASFKLSDKISLGANAGYAIGSKTSSASMVQKVNETQKQLTNTFSTYKGLTITETTQSESLNQSTRNITNHNHCHDLTIFQFEIKENILVSTSHLGDKKAVFVKYKTPCFTLEDLLCHRHIFREVLLDSSLIPCLEEICLDQFSCFGTGPDPSTETPEDENCLKVVKLRISVSVANENIGSSDNYPGILNIKIKTTNETISTNIGDSGSYSWSFPYTKEIPISRICIDNFEWLEWSFIGSNIPIYHLSVTYFSEDEPGVQRMMYNRTFNQASLVIGTDNGIEPSFNSQDLFPVLPPSSESGEESPQEEIPDEIVQESDCCTNNLLYHVNCNKLFYYKILWLLEDENQRAIRFDKYTLNGVSLLDIIDNVPLGVLQDYVVFESPNSNLIEAQDPQTEEMILNSPTGNLFSEAILGNCNGCEVIDDDKFWDWTGKTCPNNAPTITDHPLSQYQAIAGALANPFAALTPAAFSSLTSTSTLSGMIQEMMKTSIIKDPEGALKELEKVKAEVEKAKNDGDPKKKEVAEEILKEILKLEIIINATINNG